MQLEVKYNDSVMWWPGVLWCFMLSVSVQREARTRDVQLDTGREAML